MPYRPRGRPRIERPTATRNQLLRLTMWLATSMRSCQHDDGVPADRGPLTWAPVRLNVDNIVFDTSSLGAEVRMHGNFQVTTRDSLTRIERHGSWMICTVNQDRFRLLEAECQARGIATEHLCDLLPGWIAHNRRSGMERTTRFIKVRAHRGEPLNELADSQAAAAAESDSARSI
jgi:hypothetical protein